MPELLFETAISKLLIQDCWIHWREVASIASSCCMFQAIHFDVRIMRLTSQPNARRIFPPTTPTTHSSVWTKTGMLAVSYHRMHALSEDRESRAMVQELGFAEWLFLETRLILG